MSGHKALSRILAKQELVINDCRHSQDGGIIVTPAGVNDMTRGWRVSPEQALELIEREKTLTIIEIKDASVDGIFSLIPEIVKAVGFHWISDAGRVEKYWSQKQAIADFIKRAKRGTCGRLVCYGGGDLVAYSRPDRIVVATR